MNNSSNYDDWGPVAFAADGSRAAVVVGDGFVVSPMRGASPPCHAIAKQPIARLASSVDGAHLATVSQGEALVRLWNAETCRFERALELGGKLADVPHVVFGPRGQLVVAVGERGVRAWNDRGPPTDHELPGPVERMGFTPGGLFYAVTDSTPSHPAAVVTDDLRGGPRMVYQAERGMELSNALFDSRRHLVLASNGVRIWDERTGAVLRAGEVLPHEERAERTVDLAMSADGGYLVSFSGRTPTVWNTADWSKLGTLEGHAAEGIFGEFIGGTTLVTVSGPEGSARVWDVASQRLLLVFPRTQTVDFNQDRTSVVLSGPDGSRVWRPKFPLH